jgi:hypothetical protein
MDPWSGLAEPPGQPIQPLPWPAHFTDSQSTKSPKDSGANPVTISSTQKQSQTIISSKELDASLSNQRSSRTKEKQQITSPKGSGAFNVTKKKMI